MSNFFEFKAEDTRCEVHSMEEYRGKVVLVVNTATQCGFTPQYDDLQDLYEKYQQKGFVGFDQENPLTPMLESMLERTHPDYQSTSDIKWNFTKFLIDRDGNVVERFEPTTDMYEVEQKIRELL